MSNRSAHNSLSLRPIVAAFVVLGLTACASTSEIQDAIDGTNDAVTDEVIASQRANLAVNTEGQGFGPQSPRDIDAIAGNNARTFQAAPDFTQMNLCNIHFHESAEHKGGEFTDFAGNGDGAGSGTGFLYSGTLTEAETAPVDTVIGAGDYGDLTPGDTIEVHYVHTSAQVTPGPTLGACLSEAIMNPQLRVETQVFVLVNDTSANDFNNLMQVEQVNGLYQAVNMLQNTGSPVQYAGSTTGPGFNEVASPLQVSWSVRPSVSKVSIQSVAQWLDNNVFEEKSAQGVRNLVVNQDLLSQIGE